MSGIVKRVVTQQPQYPTVVDPRFAPAGSGGTSGGWEVLLMPHQRRTIYGTYYEQGTLTDVAYGSSRALRGDSGVTLITGGGSQQNGLPLLGFMVFGVSSIPGSTLRFLNINHSISAENCNLRLTAAGTVEFYWRNTLASTSATVLVANRLYCIAITGITSEQHFFIDGAEQPVGTVASPTDWMRDFNIEYQLINSSGPAVAIGGFGYEFNPAKAKAISANPWQVFQPLTRRLWAPAAAGAPAAQVPYNPWPQIGPMLAS